MSVKCSIWGILIGPKNLTSISIFPSQSGEGGGGLDRMGVGMRRNMKGSFETPICFVFKVGAIEIVGASILVGSSVDYVFHLVDSYSTFSRRNEQDDDEDDSMSEWHSYRIQLTPWLFFLPPPLTSDELQFFSVTSGFTRLIMKTKYVCHGLISLYINFHNNRTMWSTNLLVKICRWGGGGKEKEPTPLRI